MKEQALAQEGQEVVPGEAPPEAVQDTMLDEPEDDEQLQELESLLDNSKADSKPKDITKSNKEPLTVEWYLKEDSDDS
jgi:hypothetical protein